MTTEQQLRQLGARVDDLLRISARLRQENQALHDRESKLVEERAQLPGSYTQLTLPTMTE